MVQLGALSSIGAVAETGFRLSITLTAISCDFDDVPTEINLISKTVTLFSLMLKRAVHVLQDPHPVHTKQAVEAVSRIARSSDNAFDVINGMLDRVRHEGPEPSTPSDISEKWFRTCFEKHEVRYVLAHIQNLDLSLALLLQILQVGKVMSATSRTDTPEQRRINSAVIEQEHVIAQNILFVRQIQTEEVKRLFDRLRIFTEKQRSTTDLPTEAVKDPTWIPLYWLQDLETTLEPLLDSQEDMVEISEEVISSLLDDWTDWYDIRKERHHELGLWNDSSDDSESEDNGSQLSAASSRRRRYSRARRSAGRGSRGSSGKDFERQDEHQYEKPKRDEDEEAIESDEDDRVPRSRRRSRRRSMTPSVSPSRKSRPVSSAEQDLRTTSIKQPNKPQTASTKQKITEQGDNDDRATKSKNDDNSSSAKGDRKDSSKDEIKDEKRQEKKDDTKDSKQDEKPAEDSKDDKKSATSFLGDMNPLSALLLPSFLKQVMPEQKKDEKADDKPDQTVPTPPATLPGQAAGSMPTHPAVAQAAPVAPGSKPAPHRSSSHLSPSYPHSNAGWQQQQPQPQLQQPQQYQQQPRQQAIPVPQPAPASPHTSTASNRYTPQAVVQQTQPTRRPMASPTRASQLYQPALSSSTRLYDNRSQFGPGQPPPSPSYQQTNHYYAPGTQPGQVPQNRDPPMTNPNLNPHTAASRVERRSHYQPAYPEPSRRLSPAFNHARRHSLPSAPLSPPGYRTYESSGREQRSNQSPGRRSRYSPDRRSDYSPSRRRYRSPDYGPSRSPQRGSRYSPDPRLPLSPRVRPPHSPGRQHDALDPRLTGSSGQRPPDDWDDRPRPSSGRRPSRSSRSEARTSPRSSFDTRRPSRTQRTEARRPSRPSTRVSSRPLQAQAAKRFLKSGALKNFITPVMALGRR